GVAGRAAAPRRAAQPGPTLGGDAPRRRARPAGPAPSEGGGDPRAGGGPEAARKAEVEARQSAAGAPEAAAALDAQATHPADRAQAAGRCGRLRLTARVAVNTWPTSATRAGGPGRSLSPPAGPG